MKKILFGMILLALTLNSFSQNTSPSNNVKQEALLIKSKNQKKTAWILLGGGATFILLGDLIGNNKNASFGDAGTGVIMGGVGILSMLGSVPLFIASGKNKRRANAMSVFIKIQNSDVVLGFDRVHILYPALSLKIQL